MAGWGAGWYQDGVTTMYTCQDGVGGRDDGVLALKYGAVLLDNAHVGDTAGDGAEMVHPDVGWTGRRA